MDAETAADLRELLRPRRQRGPQQARDSVKPRREARIKSFPTRFLWNHHAWRTEASLLPGRSACLSRRRRVHPRPTLPQPEAQGLDLIARLQLGFHFQPRELRLQLLHPRHELLDALVDLRH